MSDMNIDGRLVGLDHPTYFIADIAANHNGSLEQAIELIHLAAEAGADAVKFQHFQAAHIVSDYGFKALGSQQSHQEKWQKSVYEVYADASLPLDWTSRLQQESNEAGVHFISAPYDIDAIRLLDSIGVPAFKMGSGDITWIESIRLMAETGKPLFVATGAASMGDVERMMEALEQYPIPVCLMQCNTNYTGELKNFRHIHLNVLKTYSVMYPDAVLGLSDHTPGHATVLGAVALGARAIEKHFTKDVEQNGPDHGFSMDPAAWREMVDRTRELELALGSSIKRVAENEQETVILQRRCLRAKRDLPAGHVLTSDDLEALRPAPADGVFPYDLSRIIGKKLVKPLKFGEHVTFEAIVS
jgi:N-acetylneuraminate synthase